MRRTYWYHEECLSQVETAVRTSKSPHHEICARCGYEGLCMEAELVTNPDVRKIELGQELKAAAEAEAKVAVEAELLDSEHERIHDSMQVTEQPVEAESTEEIEANEEAIKEAVEAVTEDAVPEEKEPDKTVPEAESEPSNILSGDIDVGPRDAEIARLEAELEALKKR